MENKYIEKDGEYYVKVDLEELSKKELIEMIKGRKDENDGWKVVYNNLRGYDRMDCLKRNPSIVTC